MPSMMARGGASSAAHVDMKSVCRKNIATKSCRPRGQALRPEKHPGTAKSFSLAEMKRILAFVTEFLHILLNLLGV
jgi:hypothetical protein